MIYKECTSRMEHSCNFIEDARIWNDYKIIFRQYATLFITFIVDEGENELAILDIIQVLVEVMDKSFQSVCELDLIFYPEKIYSLLDELIMGGMVIDTSIAEIWKHVKEVFDCDKKS
jgi:AP-3 complex subunit sigma